MRRLLLGRLHGHAMAPTVKNKLQEDVATALNVVVSRSGYRRARRAYGQCAKATREVQQELAGVPSYRVEVKVTDIPDGCPWSEDAPEPGHPEYVWHYVLAVPGVGIADATGSQLGRRAPRLLGDVPPCWTLIRTVKGSPAAPSRSEISVRFDSGDPVDAEWGFKKLLIEGR